MLSILTILQNFSHIFFYPTIHPSIINDEDDLSSIYASACKSLYMFAYICMCLFKYVSNFECFAECVYVYISINWREKEREKKEEILYQFILSKAKSYICMRVGKLKLVVV